MQAAYHFADALPILVTRAFCIVISGQGDVMPTQHAVELQQERLYEAENLRDELEDAEATVLLKWGMERIAGFAQDTGDDEAFEDACKSLRGLLKYINRFVGKRPQADAETQAKYMGYVGRFLEPLGYTQVSEAQLMQALPADPADQMGALNAILGLLTPEQDDAAGPQQPAADNTDATRPADNADHINETRSQDSDTDDSNTYFDWPF